MSCSNSLIVMVNFMCLTRLKDAQIAGKTISEYICEGVSGKD